MLQAAFEAPPDVLYHGTKDPKPLLAANTFDWARTQSRDLGYFGRGFYAALSVEHARRYGPHVLAIRLRSGARLLDGLAGTESPRSMLVPMRIPTYQAALRAFVPTIAPIDRRERVLEEFDDLYDPASASFDRLGWYALVTKWVEKSGVAAGVRWGSEVVLTDPAAIASVSKVRQARARRAVS